MCSDKLARNDRAAIYLSAILIWIETDLINTAWSTESTGGRRQGLESVRLGTHT